MQKGILIRGGTVVDGTGSAPYQADISVRDGLIAAIGPNLSDEETTVLDASGLAVTPGFIDIHRHCDIAPLRDADFGTLELAQGITTTVMGNCGLAPVPCNPAYRDALYNYIEPVIGPVPGDACYATYADYMAAFADRNPRISIGFLAAAGAIKTSIKGFAQTPYTEAEMHAAQALVREAMERGALGVSLGILYEPECYSTKEELCEVVRPAAAYDGLLTTHIRGEGDSLVASVQEVIDIAESTGLRLNISHFKATGRRNWRGTIHRAIDCIEKARARGQDVTVDFYPYDGGATTLQTLLPPCVLQSDMAATLRYLKTDMGRRAVREAIGQEHPGWDNTALSIGWDRILISSVTLPEHQAWQGKSIAAIAEVEDMTPADLVCELLSSEEGKVGIIMLSMDPADIDDIARLPYSAVISDALYAGGTHPHPRLYGAFPRVLRDFVRERHILSLEEAIHKMTGMPADRLRLTARGTLEIGSIADINVFDPQAIADHATYQQPKQLAAGIAYTLIGGRIVREAGHDSIHSEGGTPWTFMRR